MLSVMRVVGSHAVLQSGRENKIFGYADALSAVGLMISGEKSAASFSDMSDKNGLWTITIPSFEPSLSPYSFIFTCGGERLTFTDIYFGELFHISGQSNMELPLSRTLDPLEPSTLPECEYIREFRVPINCRFGKDEEYKDFPGGEWKTANRDNASDMSAAGFYFALELFSKYRVPVGLLNTSAGGAPVEAFMPFSLLSELGFYDGFLAKCTAPDYMERTAADDAQRSRKRKAELNELDRKAKKIYRKCTVPFNYSDSAELDGFCGRIRFRKKFTVPDDAQLDGALLILGTLTDADVTYLNGIFVGETGYMYPPRYYPVPEHILVHGGNTLEICLDISCGKGGFTKGKRYCLKLGDRVIDLSGEWEYAVTAKVPYPRPDTFFQGLPLSLYAALAAPAYNVGCRALIYYQGESNCNRPDRYAFLFRKFTELYRERCGCDIPVIFTQLCNYNDPFANGTDCWAELRNAQLECLAVPGTDMAVTIDIGEYNELHPKNKRDVGRRLARCAMRTVYGDSSVPPDVFCVSAELHGKGRVLLRFTDNSRVRLNEGRLECFDLLFGDRVIQPESAEMTEDGLLLGFTSETVPGFVRCEWRNDPGTPALYDTDGIPLSPFRAAVKEVGDV